MDKKIYTIGYSNLGIDKFIKLLTTNQVNVIVDVRSQPFSRYNPQFTYLKTDISPKSLKSTLKAHGIIYLFMGDLLGARTNNRECYRNGRVKYELLAEDKRFKEGISRLYDGISKHYSIALMCSESDALECHRAILIGRVLYNSGIEVLHIRNDASLESHEKLEFRMLEKLNMSESDMFSNKSELILLAYEKWGQEISYKIKDE